MSYSAPEEGFLTYWDNRPSLPAPIPKIKIMGPGKIIILGNNKIIILNV